MGETERVGGEVKKITVYPTEQIKININDKDHSMNCKCMRLFLQKARSRQMLLKLKIAHRQVVPAQVSVMPQSSLHWQIKIDPQKVILLTARVINSYVHLRRVKSKPNGALVQQWRKRLSPLI